MAFIFANKEFHISNGDIEKGYIDVIPYRRVMNNGKINLITSGRPWTYQLEEDKSLHLIYGVVNGDKKIYPGSSTTEWTRIMAEIKFPAEEIVYLLQNKDLLNKRKWQKKRHNKKKEEEEEIKINILQREDKK